MLNNTAFRELLAYQRGTKHKEKDVECPSTAISNIKERAKAIEDELAADLKVCALVNFKSISTSI